MTLKIGICNVKLDITYVKRSYVQYTPNRSFFFCVFLEEKIEEGTDLIMPRPYFDEDDGSGSEESDLDFIRPDDRDYEEKVPIVPQN